MHHMLTTQFSNHYRNDTPFQITECLNARDITYTLHNAQIELYQSSQ